MLFQVLTDGIYLLGGNLGKQRVNVKYTQRPKCEPNTQNYYQKYPILFTLIIRVLGHLGIAFLWALVHLLCTLVYGLPAFTFLWELVHLLFTYLLFLQACSLPKIIT